MPQASDEPTAITIRRVDEPTDFDGSGTKTLTTDPQVWAITLNREDGTTVDITLTATHGHARDIKIRGSRPEECTDA